MAQTSTYIEHCNLTVPSIDEALKFLMLLDPNFTIRHDETPEGKYRWCHVGTNTHYLALQEPNVSPPDSGESGKRRPYKDHGINHIGFVVQDLDAAVDRLVSAGYKKGIPAKDHPHRKRAYFYDHAGFEWEIVQYLTEKVEDRNAYDQD
eukprot:CAMPEP_0201476486 /NCGR_PEP_ID=MMETSP0151_2-20130828/1687_1 /ASSEMBLY_ACC=CAM_ASM_000257 /TAXON_ID=200890 /ORGANISM="Paramoeba atlantica, Strain 621/1 / CCAP 1560/9" /LENGTH=148 /DNA_ID=CAMNT_0047856865 /DNA_START=111 /DNA_END=557 /DNA_ORIENTATION=+